MRLTRTWVWSESLLLTIWRRFLQLAVQQFNQMHKYTQIIASHVQHGVVQEETRTQHWKLDNNRAYITERARQYATNTHLGVKRKLTPDNLAAVSAACCSCKWAPGEVTPDWTHRPSKQTGTVAGWLAGLAFCSGTPTRRLRDGHETPTRRLRDAYETAPSPVLIAHL